MNVDAALRRIDLLMAVFGVVGTIGAFALRGWQGAAAFAFGAVVSALNFRWLKDGVNLLAAKFAALAPDSPVPRSPSPVRTGVLFVLRYALLGAAGYGMFTILKASLPAFLAGLFVNVAAILGEMIFQLGLGKNA